MNKIIENIKHFCVNKTKNENSGISVFSSYIFAYTWLQSEN